MHVNGDFVLRRVALSVLFLMGSVSWALAQEAIIIGIKGQVFVRKDSKSEWQEAQINAVVAQDWEIRTKGRSSCTLAFDAKKKNIITVKDHTEIKIESVLPGKVFLPEGRVFALIKDLPGSKKFEIRTPTAISGARGTGWLTEVIAGETSVSCFDDVVFVDSLDPSGAVTGQIDLAKGLEVNIEDKAVEAADVKQVSEAGMREWQGFVENVHQFVGPEMTGPRPGPDGKMLPSPGGQPDPATGFQMNMNQMMQEAQKQMGDSPEKLAEFERMLQEGREQFGSDFEKFLMNGAEGNEAFENFMHEMIQKFGDEFDDHHTTDGSGPPGGFYPGGWQMPPPPGGFNPEGPPPGGGEGWGNPGDWNTTDGFNSGMDPYGGFNDAQHEINQTLIDTNLAACGHYCCPHPACCAVFSDPMANSFCQSH